MYQIVVIEWSGITVYICLSLNGPILSSLYLCVCVYCGCYSWLVTAGGDDLWKGRGSSIRIPLPIDCSISYSLFTYAMFVQSKMTMLLYIGGCYKNSSIIPKTVIRRRKPQKDRQCYDQHKTVEKDEHNTEYWRVSKMNPIYKLRVKIGVPGLWEKHRKTPQSRN
jgi:hypothetical protein